MRTNGGTARGLRDSALGKAAILVAVLIAALLVARSCGSRDTEVTSNEAAEIARGEVSFEPDQVVTRFVPRGIESRPTWAVSLSTLAAGGALERVTVVVVDARTGDVIEVHDQG